MRSKLEKTLFILCLLYFASAMIFLAIHVPLNYDSAHQAIVSKNFSNGYGWAISFHGKVLLWYITSGPTLLIPGALIMYFLGNALWVPGFSVVLLNLLILGFFIKKMARVLEDSYRCYGFTLGLLFFFVFYESFWWGYYLGEVSSFLLLLLACAAVSNINVKGYRKSLVLFGALVGLSLNAKLIVLPGVFGAILILFTIITPKLPAVSGVVSFGNARCFLWALLGCALVFLPVTLFNMVNLSLDGRYTFLEYLQFRREFISAKSSSGFSEALVSNDFFGHIFSNIRYQYKFLLNIFKGYGISFYGALGLMVFIFIGLFHRFRSHSNAQNNFILLLTGALCFYLIWYFLLAKLIFDRHAIHLIYLLAIIVIFIVVRHSSICGAFVLIAITFLVAPNDKKDYLASVIFFGDPSKGNYELYNGSIQKILDYLRSTDLKYPLANCGWMGATREIEYALPRSDHFFDCYQLIEEALVFDKDKNLYYWSKPVSFTLLINNITWRMAKSHGNNKKNHILLMKACRKHMLYEDPLFRLMECPFEDLKKAVPLTADTPFMNQPLWWKHE